MNIPRKPGPSIGDLPPGQYAKSLRPSRERGWAIIRCPLCARPSTIGKNHEVLADGTVTPSYVCPFCPWHVFIVLERWPEPENGDGRR